MGTRAPFGCGFGTALFWCSWAAAASGPLPLVFEPNLGQSDRPVRFLAHADGYTLFLTRTEIVASGPGGHVRVRLRGSRGDADVEGLDPLPGRSHYFTGGRSAASAVPHFARARYRGVYPGIDLVFYGDRRTVEFDFEVAPGADPSAIQMEFLEAEPRLGPDGSITAAPLRLAPPAAFQGAQGIAASFAMEGANRAVFRLAAYDHRRPLRIDPAMSYSTYLGGDTMASGGNDFIRGAATDAAGNVYLAGTTESPTFPTVNAPTPSYRGGPSNAFLAKIAPDGTPIFATYFGGDSLSVEATAIAVDPAGNAYVTGSSLSGTFPATAGAYQNQRAGGRDAFVLKLDPAGQTVYATLLGGEGDDYGNLIAVDPSGSVLIAGTSASSRFPVTQGAVQPTKADYSASFLAQLGPDGGKLLFATFLGGQSDTIHALGFDTAQRCLVAGQAATNQIPATPDALRTRRVGQDGFLLILDGNGSNILYSTFLGGSSADAVRAMRIDAAGNIWLAGTSSSTDLPVTKDAAQPTPGGGGDGFLMKLDPGGREIRYLTYFGGSGADSATALAIDGSGQILLAGETSSPDLPVATSAFQTAYGGGTTDAFLAIFDPDARPVSCTYLGGSGEERLTGIALDSSGDAWLAGNTLSPNFPASEGAWRTALSTGGWDGFLARLGSYATMRVYATYVGGGGGSQGEQAADLAVDSSGAVYVAGTSYSNNFPATAGAYRTTPAGFTDAFVSKISPDGRTLLFSTVLGGAGEDSATAIALAPDGSIVMAGSTASNDFPVTEGAHQGKPGGGVDAWLARISPDGSQLLYSTYLGGTGAEAAVAVAVHASGDVFLVGNGASFDLVPAAGAPPSPLRTGAIFVARFTTEGRMAWGARVGGTTSDIAYSAAVDSAGRLVVGGSTASKDFPATGGALQGALGGSRDGFLFQLDPDGQSLVFATYLGGSNNDELRRVAMGPDGDIYAAGYTNSPNFPTTEGAYLSKPAGSDDGFIVRLKPDGSAITWSTLLGAMNQDRIFAMAVDQTSNVFAGGYVNSRNFPVTTQNAIQAASRGGLEGFVSKISSDGRNLLYSSFVGGSQDEKVTAIAVDGSGNPVIAGQTCSSDFPITEAPLQPAPVGSCNAFVAKMDLAAPPPPPPRIDAARHYVLGTSNINPGQIIRLTGANLAKASLEAAKPGEKQSGPLPRRLGGTALTMGATTVPLFSVSPAEIVAQMPYEPQSPLLRVSTSDGEGTRTVPVTFDPQWGLMAGYRADGTLVTEQNRLRLGEQVVVHLTGGVLPPKARPPDGEPVPPTPVYDQFTPPPRVFVSAAPAAEDTALDCVLVSIRMAPGYTGIVEAVVSIPASTASASGVWDLSMSIGAGLSNKLRLYHELR